MEWVIEGHAQSLRDTSPITNPITKRWKKLQPIVSVLNEKAPKCFHGQISFTWRCCPSHPGVCGEEIAPMTISSSPEGTGETEKKHSRWINTFNSTECGFWVGINQESLLYILPSSPLTGSVVLKKKEGLEAISRCCRISIEERALTLVVEVLEHDEGGFIHADRVPKAVAADDQKILVALQRHGHHVWLGRHERLVACVACQKTMLFIIIHCFQLGKLFCFPQWHGTLTTDSIMRRRRPTRQLYTHRWLETRQVVRWRGRPRPRKSPRHQGLIFFLSRPVIFYNKKKIH